MGNLPFPKLMRIKDREYGDFVILVDRLLNGVSGFGVVVDVIKSTNCPYHIGSMSDSWDLMQFDDYTGVIVIDGSRMS